MFNNYKLFDHLLLLKKYMFLTQGDFCQLLLETISIELDKTKDQIYRHNCLNIVESTIRSSNLQ
jgi:hypothetical protein